MPRFLIMLGLAVLTGCAAEAPLVQVAGRDDFERGAEHYREKRYREAKDSFTLALRSNPELSPAYTYRGNCWVNLLHHAPADGGLSEKQYLENALRDYESAKRLNPADKKAYINRAYVLCTLRRHKEAAQDLLHVVENIDRTDPDPHRFLGFIYYIAFDNAEHMARKHFAQYLALGGQDQQVAHLVATLPSSPMQAGEVSAPQSAKAADRETQAKLQWLDAIMAARGSYNEKAETLAKELIDLYIDTKYVQEHKEEIEGFLNYLETQKPK